MLTFAVSVWLSAKVSGKVTDLTNIWSVTQDIPKKQVSNTIAT